MSAILPVFVFIIAIYCLFVLLVYLLQRHLIYFPSPVNAMPSPDASGVPEMHIVELHTADGLTLKAWYQKPPLANAPTLVYFHGNAGHIGHRAFQVMPFLTAGYGVLLVTYRGYSGNPGTPCEEGLYLDARASLEFLASQNIPNRNIVLYGESIGTAVACQMASEYTVGAIILQSPFTSLEDVGKYHYPFLPVGWLIKDKFDSLKKTSQLHVPVLMLCGDNDTIIPPSLSLKLFHAFSEPKQFVSVAHSGHNDLYEPRSVILFIKLVI
jgi:fermentation-respiration switch protein FrsA (DUF1100 family)